MEKQRWKNSENQKQRHPHRINYPTKLRVVLRYWQCQGRSTLSPCLNPDTARELYPKFRTGRLGVISCQLCRLSQAGWTSIHQFWSRPQSLDGVLTQLFQFNALVLSEYVGKSLRGVPLRHVVHQYQCEPGFLWHPTLWLSVIPYYELIPYYEPFPYTSRKY